MSTQLLTMQSTDGYGAREFDVKMASDVTSLYSSQDCWDQPFFQPPTTTGAHGSQPRYVNTTAGPSCHPYSTYPAPPTFTAANTMSQPQHVATVSPLQTNSGFTYDNTSIQMSPTSSESSHKRARKDSYSHTSTPSSGGRRRKSESLEVGSARAIYLEKNRKAASKCRNKQKRQQEELVEEARDVDRKNKLLRAEVDVLRCGIRELMDIVAQHTDCPDSRLRLYLQREADRLAGGGPRTAYPQPQQSSNKSPYEHRLPSQESMSPPKPQ